MTQNQFKSSSYLYESDWREYVHNNTGARFATAEEIKSQFSKIDLTKEKIEHCGIPVLVEDNFAWVNHADEHTLIAGESGSMKSRAVCKPQIHLSIKARESFIATDVKGELSSDPAIKNALKSADYEAIYLDFRNFSGDGYNLLEYPTNLYLSGNKDKALQGVKSIISSLMERYNGTKADPYWSDMSKQHIAPLICTLMEICKEKPEYKKYVNMFSVFNFSDEEATEILSNIIKYKYENTSNNQIQKLRNVFAAPERTRMSIVSTTSSVLGDFVDFDSMLRMLSCSTFNIRDMYKKPMGIFVIVPDETTAYKSIIGLIMNNIYEQLIDEFTEKYQGKNKPPRNINWICDEFCNIQIEDVASKISASRSRHHKWFIVVQSLKQLETLYPKDYHTIIGNCHNMLYLQSSDPQMQQYFSDLVGLTTISSLPKGEPLLPVENLKKLKKGWGYKEAIYIRGNIVYKTTLPDIDSYIFAKDFINKKSINVHKNKLPPVEAYTPQQFREEINKGIIQLPFTYTNIKKKAVSNLDEIFQEDENFELSDNIQKELEKKFDELFGVLSDDEED